MRSDDELNMVKDGLSRYTLAATSYRTFQRYCILYFQFIFIALNKLIVFATVTVVIVVLLLGITASGQRVTMVGRLWSAMTIDKILSSALIYPWNDNNKP